MKATKVLGIVLGALLVAALFTGAAAATDPAATELTLTGEGADDKYLGTAYAYGIYKSNVSGLDLKVNNVWKNAAGQEVVFLPAEIEGYYIDGAAVEAEGDYFVYAGGNRYHIDVQLPSVAISGSVYKNVTTGTWDNDKKNLTGALIGSTVMNDKFIDINATKIGTTYIAFTNPDGKITSIKPWEAFKLNITGKEDLKPVDLGIWTVQAYYEKGQIDAIGTVDLTNYAPDFMLGKPYYFTVISSDDGKKLEALTPEIIQGGYATIQVTAPTGTWDIAVNKEAEIPLGQPLVGYDNLEPITDKKHYNISVGAEGIATFSVTTTTTTNIKVELLDKKDSDDKYPVLKSVTVKVTAGAISAEADATSVFIGDEFDIDGTNDISGNVYFFIKGTNYKFQPVLKSNNENDFLYASGKDWTATVDTEYLKSGEKKPDAGTYTVYIASLTEKVKVKVEELGTEDDILNLSVDDMDESDLVKAYATVSVALKQPFISITKAPEVLVQGEKLVVEGTAEGEPKEVQVYVFGTNKFIFKTESVTDGIFSFELSKSETDKDNLAAGQYFLVVQHPMYDKDFNIGAVLNASNFEEQGYKKGDVILNKNGKWNADGNQTILFNTDKRQSANAAQALCDALDSQDIDDMYAKASFIVAGPTSYIDAIPSEITKGQVLTISGTTTGHKDDVVTVELLSTAFAAIPKEAVGSASFVALTTKIDESGVWSISFDTSNLNADEYTCSVAVGQLDATSSKISIVEGTNPQPTQTTTPVTPTAQPTAQPTQTPATPGFGALAALAGLGAVAVLLLRRQ